MVTRGTVRKWSRGMSVHRKINSGPIKWTRNAYICTAIGLLRKTSWFSVRNNDVRINTCQEENTQRRYSRWFYPFILHYVLCEEWSNVLYNTEVCYMVLGKYGKNRILPCIGYTVKKPQWYYHYSTKALAQYLVVLYSRTRFTFHMLTISSLLLPRQLT